VTELTHALLSEAVGGAYVALRATVTLQPAGGPGDKVFPPSYGVENNAENKYAVERRMVDGQPIDTVLLDSVASQSNRKELALLEAWRDGDLKFPNPYVDFSDTDGLADLDIISVLQAPHRIADAIFRDSMLDGTLFRLSDVGQAVTDATPASATALFRYNPTALLFGMWDSTGPKGGLGSKFQRALVSEIVGVNVATGKKVGSRIDPLGVQLNAGPVFESRTDGAEWTLDEADAVKEKDKPKPFDRKGVSDKPGRPSMINHGNFKPSIDARAGGVTIDHAKQTTVISFPALRRLRFPIGSDGTPIPADRRKEAEQAARTAIAALGVAAIAYQYEMDYDLRSRCLLVPVEAPRIELVPRDGSAPTSVELTTEQVRRLVADAAAAAASAGLGWHDDVVRLEPAPKLVELVRRSRNLAARNEGDDS
jgi:CRISPR-associated protein Csb1